MAVRALILGLDVSARRIGWALVDYETGKPIACDVQAVSADDDLRARRVAFREVARDADARGDVCAVLLEDAHAGPSRRGTVIHALSVGNVEAWAAARWPDVLVDRVTPAAWRSAAGLPSKGKQPVMDWATELLRYRPTQDAADALGIATAGHRLVWETHIGDARLPAKTKATPLGKEAER